MYYCENCCSEITGEVFGTGDDATGYCSNCKEHVNCLDDEIYDANKLMIITGEK